MKALAQREEANRSGKMTVSLLVWVFNLNHVICQTMLTFKIITMISLLLKKDISKLCLLWFVVIISSSKPLKNTNNEY